MDTKPLSKQAENYISSQLLRFGFDVHELSYDREGSDILITEEGSNKYQLKYIKIQCKGRTLNKYTFVKIPVSYVQENFVLFTYILDAVKNEHLFIFFPEEIKNWKIINENYRLSITSKNIINEYFKNRIFNDYTSRKLKEKLTKSPLKENTSMFIDGIFLEKAIERTIATYSSIYPSKKFIKPNLKTLICNLLDSYNNYKIERKIINCFVFLSRSFSLEMKVDINNNDLKFQTHKGNIARIFINKTDEMIAFEIMEEIERIKDNDNILLVAGDRVYENQLSELHQKGFDMIIIKSNYHDETDMYTEFRWGDISYPIGISIGLEKHEI